MTSQIRFLDTNADAATLDLMKKLRESKEPDRIFAEAIADRSRDAWKGRRRLKETSGHPCFARLVGKRCHHIMDLSESDKHLPCRPPCSDHLSMWLRDGKPAVLVSQPYQASGKDLHALLSLCAEHDVYCMVSSHSWYYPSATLFIEMWAPGVKPWEHE